MAGDKWHSKNLGMKLRKEQNLEVVCHVCLGLDETVLCGSSFTDKGFETAFLFSFLISQICQQLLNTRISY